ncbi:MAG: Lipid A biosynthesis lauroyl acyltransferase [candidate division BRC1 bacterium ADurb.BinA364]|nr:MAG: Lipid A biosynthesis lauroyl acyltransferase [candidate division BRC1 bacterium ADurb.BinA364]
MSAVRSETKANSEPSLASDSSADSNSPPRPIRFKHRLEAFFSLGTMFLLAHLPVWGLRLAASALAMLAFDALRIRRAVTLQNIRQAFPGAPPGERIRIGRAAYRHAVYATAEFARLQRRNARPFSSLIVSIEPPGAVEWMAGHLPLVMAIGHLGNWELLAHYLSEQGLAVAAIYKPMHNPIMDDRFLRIRRLSGAEYISTRQSDRQVWGLLGQAIRRKSILGVMIDQDAGKHGAFVPFFGREASTFTGAATMALRHGLPVIFCACVRESPGRLRLIADGPIESPAGGRTPENVHELTRRINERLENAIRRWPEQYFWFHRRWKSQPRKKTPS